MIIITIITADGNAKASYNNDNVIIIIMITIIMITFIPKENAKARLSKHDRLQASVTAIDNDIANYDYPAFSKVVMITSDNNNDKKVITSDACAQRWAPLSWLIKEVL